MGENMLSTTELAAVTNRLQVPLTVSDIMRGETSLSDDVQYALHETISDLQPDTALLCIALSTKKIAAIYANASPSMKILDIECARIIEDYAALWLQNAAEQDVDQEEVLEALSHVTEDLEYMAELLDLNISFLRAKDETASNLCEILYVQASAHAMIAEEFQAALNLERRENEAQAYHAAFATSRANDNVIQFPGRKS